MWLDAAVILLCIAQTSVLSLPTHPISSKSQEEGENMYGSVSETPLDNNLSKQNDPSETDYVYEEPVEEAESLSSEEPKAEDDDNDEFYSDNDEIQQDVSENPQRNRKHRRNKVVAVMNKSGENKYESSMDLEPDKEDEMEYAGSDLSNEGGDDQSYIYENVGPPNEKIRSKFNRRQKRLTIVSRNRVVSSSEPPESADELIVNESDDYDYADKGSYQNYGQTRSGTSYIKGSRIVAKLTSSLVSSSTSETKGMEQVFMKNFCHDTKSKQGYNRPECPSKHKSGNFSATNSFPALTKAYNLLVCAVESFMELANKTINDNQKPQDNTMATEASSADASATDTSTAASIKTNDTPNTEGAVRNAVTTITLAHTDSTPMETLFGEEMCTTRRKPEKGESTISCQPVDRGTTEYYHPKNDEDDSMAQAGLKKKQLKSPKGDYVTPEYLSDHGGMYVYNDYDSVDPSEDITELAPKLTLFPATRTRYMNTKSSVPASDTDIEKQLWKDWAVRKVSARRNGNEVNIRKDVIATLNTTDNYNSLITKSFRQLQVKHIVKHGRKLKEKRKFHPAFGESQTRQKHFSNFTEGSHLIERDMNHKHMDTGKLKKVLPDTEDDTEIIEVEYQ